MNPYGHESTDPRVRSVLHVDNIHCQSCVDNINGIITAFSPPPSAVDLEKSEPLISDVDVSLANRSVTFTHPQSFSYNAMLKQLDVAGFDVRIGSGDTLTSPAQIAGPSRWGWLRNPFRRTKSKQRETAHRETCKVCRKEEESHTNTVVEPSSAEKQILHETRFAIEGMTCSSCTSAISDGLSPSAEPGIRSCEVTLLPASVVVVHDASIITAVDIKELIQEVGYGAQLVSSKPLPLAGGSLDEISREPTAYKVIYSVLGMTCASCVSSVSNAMESVPGTTAVSVDLMGKTGSVVVKNKADAELVRTEMEDVGFECSIVQILEQYDKAVEKTREPTAYKVIYSVLGMTCASCVSSVSNAMESVPGTTAVSVDLMGKTGSVVVKNKADAELVRTEMEDVGFECSIVQILEQYDDKATASSQKRVVTVKVDGMFCGDCVKKVNGSLESLSQAHALTFTPISFENPTITLTYIPKAPAFTLRLVRDEIADLGFTLSVVHVDSIEDRAARARAREQRNILIRFGVTLLFAIPTFIIAVIGVSLLGKNNRVRMNLETPAWGNASRATVALFALCTPVQFGVGWFFYQRAWKGLKGVWRTRRAGSNWRRVWVERLFRWGSMDSLVSLGTSTGYFASLALMVLDIQTTPQEGKESGELGWFDSSVFLILFILAGRYLESISKQRTGNAISTLSSTKPSTGLLYTSTGASTVEEPADFLEVGDILIVPAGSSPPLDAVLADSSPQTTFDESSLTGEARPVLKSPGDEVYAGTTNAGPAAAVVTITNEVGHTMLDGIVGVVREAMGKKAGIERIADIVTGYFVPFVVGVAGLTFGVWCLRGYLGGLPEDWMSSEREGGWALFAVQFGVAVLVVACPCGIGLAAPTAQLVGVGLAAQNGILSNGGGEAFQTISSMNTVVLDKTGTLTTSKFTVSNHRILTDTSSHNLVCSLLRAAEQASTHPLAVGVRDWCQTLLEEAKTPSASVDLVSSEEIPGRGLIATLIVEATKVEVAIGNEKLMQDVQAVYSSDEVSAQSQTDLLAWQTGGKSVILLSVKLIQDSSSNELPLPINAERHYVLGLFGVHDPPRPEAAALVAELQHRKMNVWMISGDNAITAKTVARSVGIDENHVVASALPVDKQEWVKKLQGNAATEHRAWWKPKPSGRSIVAFCGDGINDAPAIAQADVGLAMGGGSNVAVSTADFCLLGSNLLAIVTVYDLARKTRRKIISNFVWACLYNVSLMPLAAGAFYPLGRTTLPPVWGSAAMAMSSVSVVVNSLFLRWTYRPPRVVREWSRGQV